MVFITNLGASSSNPFATISQNARNQLSIRTNLFWEEMRRRREEEERQRRAHERIQRLAEQARQRMIGESDNAIPSPFGRGGGGLGAQFGRLGEGMRGIGRNVRAANLMTVPSQVLSPELQQEQRAARRRQRQVAQESALTAMSGQRLLGHLGVETTGLPKPAQYLIDAAAAPVNWLGVGTASSGARASYAAGKITFKELAAQLGRRTAAEIAADVAARKGGELAAEAPGVKKLPTPARIGIALGAGALAGGAAYGAVWKGTGVKLKLRKEEIGTPTRPVEAPKELAPSLMEQEGILHTVGDEGAQRAVRERQQTLRTAGPIGEVVGKVPGTTRAAGVVNPSVSMPFDVRVGYASQASAENDLKTTFAVNRKPLLKRVKDVFSEAPDYIGPADRSIAGTFLDIAEHPQDYILTPEQTDVLRLIDKHNMDALNVLRGQYGTDILPYQPDNPGAIYLPHVNTAADVAEAMDVTSSTMARGSFLKERSYDTAALRMKEDPFFTPETDLEKLLAYHDNAVAKAAGKRTFMTAVPGKTKVEAVEELHPGLRKARDTLRSATESLRGKIRTAETKLKASKKVEKLTDSEVKRLEKRMAKMRERVDALTEEGGYGPELSHLSGQLYEDRLLIARLEKVKQPDLAETVKDLKRQWTKARKEWMRLSKRYRNAGTGPYVFNRSTYRYYDPETSRAVDEILRISNGPGLDRALETMDVFRNTALSGDASPLFIQGMLNVFRAPATASKTIGNIVLHLDTRLDEIARREPELVSEFVRARARALGQVDPEFAPSKSLIAKIPWFGTHVVNPAEQSMLNILHRLEYETWKRTRAFLIATGSDGTEASYGAANALSKSVPGLSTVERGVSVARAKVERGIWTSTSFMTSPALLVKDATSAMTKMFVGKSLRELPPAERVALVHLFNLASGLSLASATSAALFAGERGISKERAMQEAFTPGTKHFWALHLPGGRTVPLGGPFRSFIQGVTPRYRNGNWESPNLARFAFSKLSPPVTTPIELVRNKDYWGRPILKGDLAEQVLRGVEYAIEGTGVPLSIGNVMEDVRQAVDNNESRAIGSVLEDFWSGLMGGNVTQSSEWDKFQQKIRKDSEFKEFGKDIDYKDLPEWAQERAVQKFGMPQPFSLESRQKREKLDALRESNAAEEEADAFDLKVGKITAREWKSHHEKRVTEEISYAQGLYATSNYTKDRVTPLTEYWDMYRTNRKPNGEPDFDKIDELVALKPQEWRDYVDTYYEKRPQQGSEAEIEFEQAKDKIRKSGYWDMKQGRADYLRAHPDIRAALTKWDYSPALTRYLDLEDEARQRQRALDSQYAEGNQEWVDKTRKVIDDFRAQGHALFGDMPEEEKPVTDILEQWFRKMDEYKDAAGFTDFAKVESWVDSQPEWAQQAIDNYEGNYLTPRVRDWKHDLRTIARSGYWDVADKHAKAAASTFGFDPKTTTWQSLQDGMAVKIKDSLLSSGYTSQQADLLVPRLLERQLKGVNNVISAERKTIRLSNPELGLLLVKWNYWQPGLKDSTILATYIGQ